MKIKCPTENSFKPFREAFFLFTEKINKKGQRKMNMYNTNGISPGDY